MPKPITLVAKLNLSGPHNVKPVVAAIQRQLSSVKANININIDPRIANNIKVVGQRISQLNQNLIQTTGSANNLNNALKGLGTTFQQLGNAQQAVNNVQKTNKAIQQTANVTKVAKTEMEKFGEQAALAVRRFTAFTVATGVIFGFVRAVQTATNEAIKFDKELTRVAQVTGLTKKNLEPLVNEITRLSVSLGVSSTELLDVAQTLAQAGLSADDTRKALEALAKSSLAPSFSDIKNTTEAVIATMSQFEIKAKDMEAVLGSINAVSAAYAAEAEDLTTVIRRVGGVFATAAGQIDDPKDSLNELIALFTSVRSTTRESAETIATGFRTIFSRLQRRGTIDFLRNYNIELLDTEGRFIGVYEAVRRLNQGLSQFQKGDIALAGILEELGGFRQISKTIPLIQQFAKAEEALQVAQKGQTSLTEDAIVAQQSFANQIAKVREQFLALVREISQSATFNVLTKSILGVASALINVADTLQPILPLLTAIAGIKLVSGITQFTSGFFGGIRSGGGAAGVGSGVAGIATGQQSAQASTAVVNSQRSLISALGNNTVGLQNLTAAMTNLANRFAISAVRKFARGGLVPGSGSGDIVPANLEPGEFVVRKAAVKAMGADALYRANRFASGGDVPFTSGKAARAALANKPDVNRQSGTNVLVGSLTNPSIGGLFLRPSPGADKNSIREKLFKALPQDQQKIISGKVGMEPSALQNAKVMSAIELNLIEPQTASLLEERMEAGMVFAVNDLMKRFGAGFDIPGDKAVRDILRNSGLDAVVGSIFESFVSSLVGNVKTSSTDRVDLRASGVNRGALSQLFGPTQAEFLDVKKSLNNDNISKVFSQGLSAVAGLPVSLIQGTPGFANLGSTGSKLSRRRFAGGGRAGAGDIIPAMLEPGEFVLNKRSASKIGATTLNAMNRVGYASGGFVHPTRRGVRQQLTLAATAQAGGAGAAFVQAADQSFRDVALSNKEYVAVMQRSVQLQQKGLTVEEAKNRSLAALNQVRAKELAQGGFSGISTRADRSKDPVFRAIAAGVSPASLGSLPTSRGFLGRLQDRFAVDASSKKTLTEEQQQARSLRRSIIGSSIASAGFVAAGQLEGRGPVGSAAASGLSGGLLIGGLAAQISGPFGLIAGSAVGLYTALDRYAQEINAIEIGKQTKRFSDSIEEFSKLLESGGNTSFVLNEATDALAKRRAARLDPNRSLDTRIGSFLASGLRDDINGRVNNLKSDQATLGFFGTLSATLSELTGGIGVSESASNIRRDAVTEEREGFKALREPIFASIRKQIQSGLDLDQIEGRLTAEQRNIVSLGTTGGRDIRPILEKVFKSDLGAQALQDQLSGITRSIDLLTEKFATLNAETQLTTAVVQDAADADRLRFSILSGGVGGITNSTSLSRTLGNIRGSSLSDVGAATRSLEGSGRLDSAAASTVRDTSLVFKELPKILSRLNLADTSVSVEDALADEVSKLDIGRELKDNILKFAGTIDDPTDGVDKDFLNKFEVGIENVLGSVSKEAVDLAIASAKLLEAQTQKYISSMQEAIAANKQFVAVQLDVVDLTTRATALRAEGEGRRLTDRELLAPLTGRLGVLGTRSPAGLGGRIASLTGRQASLSESLRTAGSPDEAKRFGDELAIVTAELDKAKTALDLFAKDTTIAAVAQEKLSRAAELRSVTREISSGLLGGNKLAFGKQINALGRFQSGDLSVVKSSFDDLSAAIDLQVKFLKSIGKLAEADVVERNFEKGIAAALGPGGEEIAKLFALSRDEEAGARELQKKAAEIQIKAAEETLKAQAALLKAITGGVPARATGGIIRGPGSGRSDSIMARVSNGEFVVNAAATARHRDLLEHINDGSPTFAIGGHVQRAAQRALRRRGRLGRLGTVGADLNRFVASGSFTADTGTTFNAFMRNNRAFTTGVNGRVAPIGELIAQNRRFRRRNAIAARRRNAGFADGGIVSTGGGVSLDSQSMGTLNSFAIAANSLANALNGLQNIPTTISLTGTHTVEVVINGASVLQNLLEGPLGNIVREEIEASLARYDRNLRG